MAGIIPLANTSADYGTQIPPCMHPVNSGFTMIQKAVVECAIVGCQTIWVVVNDDVAPVVRKHVGDWVYDPVYYNSTQRFSSETRKEIPIYYVPILPKARDRRDSYGWSALFGIHSAWYVSRRLSKWLTPEKYYITFPYGAYDPYSLRPHRQEISTLKYNFFISFDDKTAKDNEYLGFTMLPEDFKKCRRHVNASTTKTYENTKEGEQYPTTKLPLHERWSARHFDFATVFSEVEEEGALYHPIDWYYGIDRWDNYREFLRSKNLIETPPKFLTKPHKHVKICIQEE